MRIKSNLLAAMAVGALAAAGSQGRGVPADRKTGEGAARADCRLKQRHAEVERYKADTTNAVDSRQVMRRALLKRAKRIAGGRGWRETFAELLSSDLYRSNALARRNAPEAAGQRAARTPSPSPVRAAQSGAGQ